MSCSLYYDSPAGILRIMSNGSGLTSVVFVNEKQKDKPDRICREAESQLHEYFGGKRREFNIPIQLEGTAFQKTVWKHCQQIEYGEHRSYKELSVGIENKKAIRAVGAAISKNPILLIVPCHRVIGSSGKLHGYSGGIDRKRYLLNLEAELSKKLGQTQIIFNE